MDIFDQDLATQNSGDMNYNSKTSMAVDARNNTAVTNRMEVNPSSQNGTIYFHLCPSTFK